MYRINRIFKPEIFQGKFKKKNYFEGWYYKIVDQSEQHSLALIPGIALDKEGVGHSFIQVIDSIEYKTEYFKFLRSDFKYSESELDVSLENNHFTQKGVTIDLSNEFYSIKGSLKFLNIEAFPKTLFRPGIMGPFSFVPAMECYHGVVNIHHEIQGSFMINGELVDFSGGYGYIEKDWGKSFPNWYVWMQSNHFKEKDASLMFSIANIPFLGTSFTGFISFLKFEGKMILFATYTGAQVKKLDYAKGHINILVEDGKHSLSIKGLYDKSGVLKAPKNGLMDRVISESISSTIQVVLKDKKGTVLFSDQGESAGLEVVGKHL